MNAEIVGHIIVAKVEQVEEYGLYLNFKGGRMLVLIADTVVSPGTRLRTSFHPDDVLLVRATKYIPERNIFQGTLNITFNEHPQAHKSRSK